MFSTTIAYDPGLILFGIEMLNSLEFVGLPLGVLALKSVTTAPLKGFIRCIVSSENPLPLIVTALPIPKVALFT